MPRTRPYSALSTSELEGLSKDAGPAVTDDIVYELGFRSRPAAKALLAKLQGQQGSETRHAKRAQEGSFKNGQSAEASRTGASGAGSGRPAFPPTEEQRTAIAAFNSGGSLKVTAFAGAGKTSTLLFMACEKRNRGIYLAFNRAIAREARTKFPGHVDSRTTHSLAARQVRNLHNYSRSKMFDPLVANQLASILDLKRTRIEEKVTLTPPQVAFLFLGTVRQFMRSADSDISADHVPISGRLRGLDREAIKRVREWIVAEAKNVWGRMIAPTEDLPLGHDGYLKLWSLSNPKLDYSFILLDEAQDTNPVVLHVLTRQPHAQMVFIGDRHQQIYEWRGAINAMAKLTTDNEVKLTQSFRFGPTIADAATKVLRTLGESEPIRGSAQVKSSIVSSGDTRAILARTNAAVISETLAAVHREQAPHIVGGTQELQALVRDVFSLMEGEPGSHPVFFGFSSWEEVVEFAECDEGEDIRPFVTLVQQNGPGRLWAAIANAIDDETKADVVISTAHKSKGREWQSVRIADDFSSSHTEDGRIPAPEARLFYVAITRAKERLSIDSQLLAAFSNGRAIEGTAAEGS